MADQIENQHIMIIDDEPEIHSILGKTLTSKGYEVSSAYSAKSAIEMIKTKKPNLIILDIMMPEISGIELCEIIKSDPETKDILVLILSAKDAQSDRLEGLSTGADDYESKPFHLKSLIRKIEHMLEKKSKDDFNEKLDR